MSITFLTGTINFSPLLFKVFQIKNNQKKKKIYQFQLHIADSARLLPISSLQIICTNN